MTIIFLTTKRFEAQNKFFMGLFRNDVMFVIEKPELTP